MGDYDTATRVHCACAEHTSGSATDYEGHGPSIRRDTGLRRSHCPGVPGLGERLRPGRSRTIHRRRQSGLQLLDGVFALISRRGGVGRNRARPSPSSSSKVWRRSGGKLESSSRAQVVAASDFVLSSGSTDLGGRQNWWGVLNEGPQVGRAHALRLELR
jgi:hypothetical protein